MVVIFTMVWAFMLMSTWFVTSSKILDGDDESKTFKSKSLFYWGTTFLTFFAGYYLTK